MIWRRFYYDYYDREKVLLWYGEGVDKVIL